MDMPGGAIAGSAIAGAVLYAPGAGSGSVHGESVGETFGPMDALVPQTVFGSVLSVNFGAIDGFLAHLAASSSFADGMALGDASSAPGGTTFDPVGDSIDLTDAFAASGIWTVVAQPAGGWSEVSPGSTAWTTVPAAPGLWLKH